MTTKKIVTPGHKTTPTTAKKKAPAKKAPAKSKGAAPKAKDPVADLKAMLATTGGFSDTGGYAGASTYEQWLQESGARMYTGARAGTASTHKVAYNVLTHFSKLDAGSVKSVQQMLYAAGFYGNMKRADVAWGDGSDPATREAYAWALALGIQTDQEAGGDVIGFDQFLLNKAKYAITGDAAAGAKGPVFSYTPPDPQQLRDAAEQVLPSYLGRDLSPEDKDKLVADFSAQFESYARSDFNAAQGGGASLPKPDFESFVKKRANDLHPGEADLFNKFNLVGDVTRILGLNGGGNG